MTAVVECPICHHTGHLSVNTGWKKEIDGVAIMGSCQVPVQMRLPSNPHQILAMPCGCDGRGIATPEPVPEKLPELSACFNPGCQEFALLTSSFCSVECRDEMAQSISGPPRVVQPTPDDGGDDEWMDL